MVITYRACRWFAPRVVQIRQDLSYLSTGMVRLGLPLRTCLPDQNPGIASSNSKSVAGDTRTRSKFGDTRIHVVVASLAVEPGRNCPMKSSPASTSDSALLQQAVEGNAVSLSALLKRHAGSARRAVAGRIPRRWRSVLSEDDVLQQTFADAARDIRGFVGETDRAFAKWLQRLTECNLRDAIRMLEAEKRGGNRKRVELPGTGDSHQGLLSMLSADGSTPLHHTSNEELRSVLEASIAKLPEAYRTVIRMVDLGGASVGEVSAVIGRSRGAVYMLRARGHERLREVLGATTNFFGGSV